MLRSRPSDWAGINFNYALTVFSMAVMLGPDAPAVVPLIPETREILVDLRATALLEQFDGAVAAGEVRARVGTAQQADTERGAVTRP
jgi:hypothetical protein